MLRKAFHHESIVIDRKTSPTIRVGQPRLAVVLSGTPDQFGRLVEGIEDGLYSRMAVYRFDAPLTYKSQRPRPRDKEFEAFLETSAAQLLELFHNLESRTEPLWVDLDDTIWDCIDNAFEALFRVCFEEGTVDSKLAASVKRAPLISIRIAVVLAVIRQWEKGSKLDQAQSIAMSEADIKAGLALGLAFVENSLRLAMELHPRLGSAPNLSDIPGFNRMTQQEREFYDALPVKYQTAQALEIAKDREISKRRYHRLQNRWQSSGLIDKVKQGQYSKRVTIDTSSTLDTLDIVPF